MRLCIADPPYLGSAHRWYGIGGKGKSRGKGRADEHPEAYLWDNPESHVLLAQKLLTEFDGFAIALTPHSLSQYLSVIETGRTNGIRVMSWIKPASPPSGNRITQSWEPVIVKIPHIRKGRKIGRQMVDHLVAAAPRKGFAGSKPVAWTHWVLDAMGYQEGDEVVDMFNGSGAVSAAIQSYKFM